MRAWLLFTLTAGMLGATAPAVPARQQPSFRSTSTELVVLPVTVTDRKGGFVTDLTADQFVVLDNGRRQSIELFSNEDIPVTIAIVIDNSSSMRAKQGHVLAATLALAKSSNPHDEIFTLEFNDRVRDPMAGRAIFAGDLDALQLGLSSLKPEGRTALYDGLVEALERIEKSARPRKVIVVMSDGADNASRATLDQVLARARQSEASVFTIGLFDEDDPDKNPGVLKALARATGGRRFLPQSPGHLLQACERIAREIRNVYTIGYVPPDRDGAYHRVQVRVDPAERRRVEVHTRPGYVAARESTP